MCQDSIPGRWNPFLGVIQLFGRFFAWISEINRILLGLPGPQFLCRVGLRRPEDPDPGHKSQQEAINLQPWFLSRGPAAQGGSPAAVPLPQASWQSLGETETPWVHLKASLQPGSAAVLTEAAAASTQGPPLPHLYFQTFIPREGTKIISKWPFLFSFFKSGNYQ